MPTDATVGRVSAATDDPVADVVVRQMICVVRRISAEIVPEKPLPNWAV